VKSALMSTAIVAAVATFGDWVWAAFLSRHLMVAGLIHGALLCLAMGAVLGIPDGRPGRGAASGIAVGIAAAGLFYLLAPLLRMGAMLVAWFALWMMLSAAARALAPRTRPWREMLIRGAAAGVLSGAAFYMVSGMWTGWDPAAINYVDHAARWAFAFAPGFLALQASRTPPV
jgi:hypothetical protein